MPVDYSKWNKIEVNFVVVVVRDWSCMLNFER